MRGSLIHRLLFGLVALSLLGYVIFQVYRILDSRQETETVYADVVQESVKTGGVILRDELVLEDRISGGVANYLVSDGVKISAGMPIVEIYSNAQDAEYVFQIRELQNQQALLRKAQDPSTTSYAHTDILNKQIFKELGSIIDQVNTSNLTALPTASDRLRQSMNTKQIATGRQENFDAALNVMEQQESYYAGMIREAAREITTTRAGYFIRQTDGFEGKVDLKALDELTIERINALLLQPIKSDPTIAGKLMLTHNWYYAAVIPTDQLEPFRIGRSVTLNFGVSGLDPAPAVVYAVNQEKDKDQTVVVFQSDYINEGLVNLRLTSAEVGFKSVSGLRVSKDALRFEGLEQGVYVIRGNNLSFRPVTVIYEGNGFVLCQAANVADPDYVLQLQQFDEVVVKGGNLYDGKPIRQ